LNCPSAPLAGLGVLPLGSELGQPVQTPYLQFLPVGQHHTPAPATGRSHRPRAGDVDDHRPWNGDRPTPKDGDGLAGHLQRWPAPPPHGNHDRSDHATDTHHKSRHPDSILRGSHVDGHRSPINLQDGRQRGQ
jgi:hypothetical protein